MVTFNLIFKKENNFFGKFNKGKQQKNELTLQVLIKHSLRNICPPKRKHVGKRIKRKMSKNDRKVIYL